MVKVDLNMPWKTCKYPNIARQHAINLRRMAHKDPSTSTIARVRKGMANAWAQRFIELIRLENATHHA